MVAADTSKAEIVEFFTKHPQIDTPTKVINIPMTNCHQNVCEYFILLRFQKINVAISAFRFVLSEFHCVKIALSSYFSNVVITQWSTPGLPLLLKFFVTCIVRMSETKYRKYCYLKLITSLIAPHH